MGRTRSLVLLALAWGLGACGGPPGEPVEVVIPEGATLAEIADTLVAREVIGAKKSFVLYVRLRGKQADLKAGRYLLPTNSSWGDALDRIARGQVVTVPVTIPEGFRIAQMIEPLADITGLSPDSVGARLAEAGLAERFGVPGPGLEGYLFPDTYRFARGVGLSTVLETMVERYRATWTPDRRARLDSLGMSENELVTLASIIQAEARKVTEMPLIASVYHNRLREGWLLQADPTVLYALGGPRPRLLFAAIDSVADNPYNTYTQRGLPPGPIGAPGDAALEAALHPAETQYMYFVAQTDGSHVFSRTLAEHNRAVAEYRRQQRDGRRP